jgi:PAS domain S-box-containing protein
MAQEIDLMEEIRVLKVLAMQNARPLFEEKIAMLSPSIVVDTADGLILHSTKRANELFGYEDLNGMNIKSLMPMQFRKAHDQHLSSFKDNPQARPMGHAQMNLVAVNKAGIEFSVEIGLEPLQMLGRKLAIATILKTRK